MLPTIKYVIKGKKRRSWLTIFSKFLDKEPVGDGLEVRDRRNH